MTNLIKIFLPLLIILGLLNFSSCFAQLEFEDKSDDFFLEEVFGILPISAGDLNGDGLDDLVFSPRGTSLSIAYQLSEGGFYLQDYGSLPADAGSLWALVSADINEDGFNEIIAGFGQKLYNFKNNLVRNEWSFEEVDDQVFCQNISAADYDKDGLLDVFVCNDVSYNELYSSQAGGSDLLPKSILDQNIAYQGGGNYGSAFSDIDNDGDLDLYVAKCKQGDTDPLSPDRINVLYRNEDGTLVEEVMDIGLSIGAQSWTGTFGDLDNDLDFDLIVTNHTDSNMILLNDGTGLFTPTFLPGFRTTRFSLQSILRDFDNNGFLDILVTGTEHAIFLNNGDLSFIEKDMDEFSSTMLSCAVGDFDSDGFTDIYGSSGQVFVLPSNLPDRIYFNKGNDNNFVGFNLRGSESHINAIGATVTLYDQGVPKFIREVTMGDSYGIGNSMSVHFGLGALTSFDSIVVNWPSSTGTVAYTDLAINQYHLITEDCGKVDLMDLSSGSSLVELCSGDHYLLSAPEGAYEYLWNTGDRSRELLIGEEGFYQVTITDVSTGCQSFSKTVFVDIDPVIRTKVDSEARGIRNFCVDDEIEICLDEKRYDVEWNTGDTERCITVSESGSYFARILGSCEEAFSDTLEMVFLSYNAPNVVEMRYDSDNDILENEASGDNIIWYADSLGQDSIGEGNTIVLEQVMDDTTVYAQSEGRLIDSIQSGGKLDLTGNGGENFPNFPGGLQFDVDNPFYLLSVDVYCFEESTVELILRDRNVNILVFEEVELDTGWNTIDLDVFLEVNKNYQINFQGDPNAFRNTGNVNYPYAIGSDLGQITSGIFTDSEYFYFYNWRVREYDLNCTSERVPFIFLISSSEENGVGQEGGWTLNPNPANTFVRALIPEGKEVEVVFYDVDGHRMETQTGVRRGTALEVSQLPNGFYFVKFIDEKGMQQSSKLIIAR